ncbi:hemicentin-1-like isoform X2 [Mya arenaria]|uniref:hemicentin-1-like isoform X2 n=1 Tax=Mya arenaria TaxID=6604 RepID=UPI0022E8F954|nr:hemicentin-1-like isoform X2 [Mya arenaria]
MELYSFLLVWINTLVFIDSVRACPASSPRLFQRVHDDVVKISMITTVNTQGLISYHIRKDETNLMSIDFYNGAIMDQEPCTPTDCTFSGNAANGDFSITLSNIQVTSAGTYKVIETQSKEEKACKTLFVLGDPEPPIISSNNDPSVGGNVSVTCSSTSTTTPKNHGLSLSYTWLIDGHTNPANTRYSYSASRHKLTISYVRKMDSTIVMKCSATENVTNGYTSSESLGFTINVLYGPDSVSFSPNITSYEKLLNTVLDPVMCQADCNGCSFSWSRGQTTIVNTDVLNLMSLLVNEAGQYTCTASRTGATTKEKTLSIKVIHGPSSGSLNPADTHYTVEIGETLATVTCSASCWPCSYMWTGPGDFSSSGQTISLQGATKASDGRYTCTATNDRTSTVSSTYFDVNVVYGPESITFNTSSTTIRQREGSLFLPVECQSDCKGCTFMWNKDRAPFTSTAILDLATLQKSEAGVYSCTASRTGARSMVKQLKVQSIYGPDHAAVLPVSTQYELNDGNTMDSVVCSSDCFPECSLMWVPSLLSYQGNLSLGVLHKESAGLYTCVASNPEWSEKSVNVTITVRVRYGPVRAILNVSSPFTVTEGETIENIGCTSDCWPGCRQEWMDAANVTIQPSGTLSLEKATRDNAGSYVCILENTAEEYTKKAETSLILIVEYPPDVHVQTTNTTSDDTSVVLECIANGVPNSYTYINWKQEWPGTNLTRVIPESGYPTLRLTNLSYEYSGIYTCSVSNGVVRYPTTETVMEASTYLLVKDAPVVLFPQLSHDGVIVVSGKLGDTLSLQIKIYSNYGSVVAKLKDSGKNTSENKSVTMDVFESAVELPIMGHVRNDIGFVLNITITIEESDYFTFYPVSIENDFKATLLDIEVKSEGPPEIPRTLTIEKVMQHSIDISWFGNFNGGFKQTFAIQTSKDGVDWNNATLLEEDVLNRREQYHQTVDKLDHTTKYYLRMYAFNKLGESEHTNVLQATTASSRDITPRHASVIGGVVGGCLGAVAVIVIVFVLRRWFTLKCSCNMSLSWKIDVPSDQDGHGAENPGYNAAGAYEVVSATKESPVYDALSVGNDGPDNSRLYTPLELTNPKSNAYYENVKGEDPVYNNTVLKIPVQTVL